MRDDTKGGWEKKAMHRHPVSLTGVLLFFDLFKVHKMTNYYDLFKGSKMTILIMTGSKSAK